MNDLSDGELKFTYHEGLEAWLSTQPRGVSVVIAARAALRALPLLHRLARGDPRHFATLTFADFWANALAWVAAKYPTCANANEVRLRTFAFAASASATATTAVATATAAYVDPFAAAAASAAVTHAAAAVADWEAVSADANRLKRVAPSALASEKLWLGKAPPNWAHENNSELLGALKEPHWRPWLDWYQRRVNGREEAEEIELLFATLPIDPREKDVAEQNAELARRIAELQEALDAKKPPPADQHWDFFISYSGKDEADAREIAGILERDGHSTFAQFKDIAPGNNFVREMMRGLGGMGRMLALYSEDYQASGHCQAEWAAAYNLDPSGKKRKLIPLLLKPTPLNPLAQQLVYKSLVGLTGEARRNAILDAIAPQRAVPLSLGEAERKLAETASPRPVLNDSGQLDIAPNERVDRPYVDAALVELPYNLRSLIRALLEALPPNTPR